jgi:hypothetical protein
MFSTLKLKLAEEKWEWGPIQEIRVRPGRDASQAPPVMPRTQKSAPRGMKQRMYLVCSRSQCIGLHGIRGSRLPEFDLCPATSEQVSLLLHD